MGLTALTAWGTPAATWAANRPAATGPSSSRTAPASGGASTAPHRAAGRPSTAPAAVCVPFHQVLSLEAHRPAVAMGSYTEQEAANAALQAATTRMAALLHVAPAPVRAAVADLGRDAIVITPGPTQGGATHPQADVLVLRRYLAASCGGQQAAAQQTTGASAAAGVPAAAPGTVDLAVCVPFRQVLAFVAQRPVLAARSYVEQQAANAALRAATARMAALPRGAPAAVRTAVADLGRDAIVVTPGPALGSAAHAEADVLALRQYLAANCGGQPGTAAQEGAIRAAIRAWLPGTGITTGCISVSDIRVARADAAYATADLVQSCQQPGGGTALLHRAAGKWQVGDVVQAIPCGRAPNPVLADLFGAALPALCRAQSAPTAGTPHITPIPLQQTGPGYRVTGSYPQVAGLRGGNTQAAINAALRRAASAAVASFRHGLTALGGTLHLSYRVTYLQAPQQPYLSIQFLALRSVAGSAHPSGSVQTFTFDLRSGYRYRLANLFRPGVVYTAYLVGAARTRLDARYGKGTWQAIAAGGTAGLFAAWNLTPAGLQVTFNGAPRALGGPAVTIPYSDPVLASLAAPHALP